MTTLKINGETKKVDAPADTPILWLLRDELGMTGTKFGCGMAMCGACTVHLDGVAIRSCITPASAAEGKSINTIESMEGDRIGKAVQDAWVELSVAQCGYCQAGQIMSAVSLLRSNASPSEQQIREGMSGNLCRCGAYNRIHAAVKLASTRLSKGG